MILNKVEVQYIINNISLTDSEKKIISNGKLSDDDLLLMHDKITDRLDYVGFDRDYNITKEGILIETIMDKIHYALSSCPTKTPLDLKKDKRW